LAGVFPFRETSGAVYGDAVPFLIACRMKAVRRDRNRNDSGAVRSGLEQVIKTYGGRNMMSARPMQHAGTGLALAVLLSLSGNASAGVARDLAELRHGTAAFHNHDIAMAAGWNVELTGCMESSAGGMGIHYANLDRLADGGAIDPSRPEALMYEPREDGSLRLVGVEFLILEEDLPRTEPAPELFGQHFHFNEVFEVWALHAWVWRHNREGMFADWNPAVSCEFAD
jgi:hypothetical protein